MAAFTDCCGVGTDCERGTACETIRVAVMGGYAPLSVRGAIGLTTGRVPLTSYCFGLALRPRPLRYSLSLASCKCFTSDGVHKRTLMLPKIVDFGGRIFFAAIHAWTVALVIPTAAAASRVV